MSPSLAGCLCAVAVDLEACREPSKAAAALHDHEAVGGGRPESNLLLAAGGDHIDRLLSAAGGGPQTA